MRGKRIMKISMMKKALAALLATATLCTATACGGTTPAETETTEGTAAADTAAVTETPSDGTHLSANGITTKDDGKVRPELTALEVSDLMGNGINLGNTMEAYGHKSGTESPTTSYETLWGQPVTTQEIISAMKDSGFDALRIPIAWTNMMDYESGDYTIDDAYLNRVEEIINYARNADMYVIINDHWDGSWWGMFGSATEETRTKAMELYTSMWTQIANRYKEYSDYLIFESANEELGDRLNDKDVAKDSGSLSKAECFEMTNKINQTFVDLIRSTGGNNAERFLLIAGYNTDFDNTCDDRYIMPTDSAKNKLLVSVHYYNPWDYCGVESVNKWGSSSEYESMNNLFKKISKFTEQGYGVVIGEYAVALKDGAAKKNTADFIENLLDNCDLYGYVPMLWDCSSLFRRISLKWIDSDVEALYKARSYSAQSALTSEEIKENAKANMEKALLDAKNYEEGANPLTANPDATIAWIMFQSADYKYAYSVGDKYEPTSVTDGIVVTDAEITGEGTYTVGIDFSASGGWAKGIAFSAIGLTNGEKQFPGCIMDIQSIQINGEEYELKSKPYTSSDDGKCTRVNLYNGWVSEVPADGRTVDGSLEGCSAQPIDGPNAGVIKTLSITFNFIPGTAEAE